MNLILNNLNVSAILGIGFPYCSLPILGCQNNVNQHAETCCNLAIHAQLQNQFEEKLIILFMETPEKSMRLVYLPAWKVDWYGTVRRTGKCR